MKFTNQIFKSVLLIALFLFTSLSGFTQKSKWIQLDDYHAIMSKTFHPAEEGNLKPVLENASSLAKAALILKKSEIPSDYNKAGLKSILDKLEKESRNLSRMVSKGKSEAELKKAIFDLHDRFHEVMEVCHH